MINLLGHLPVRRKVKGETGAQGIPGVIHRTSEWAAGVEYRNDSSLTSDMRYVDIAVVTTGVNTYSVYRCKKTHTSSSSITVANTTYWEEMNSMYPIYTPLIMADNAVFRFAQTNQLYVMKDDGVTVNLAMGGGDYPLWIGAPTADDASFKVNFDGKLYATDAEISGTINATSGIFGIFEISTDSWGNGYIYCERFYDDQTEKHTLEILPDGIRMYGYFNDEIVESVIIMPYAYSDKYDTDATVSIYARPNSPALFADGKVIIGNVSETQVALTISSGMISGIRPYLYVTSSSCYINYDTVVVRGSSSRVTLWISTARLVKGAQFKVINDSSYAVRISLDSDYTIQDLINGVSGYYVDIENTVKCFTMTYDGTKLLLYE